MKMMGLNNNSFWISWIFTYIIIIFIIIILLVIITKPTVFPNSNIILLFLFFFLFNLSLISLACCVSVFFQRARIAGFCAIIIVFSIRLPIFAMDDNTIQL